MVASANTAQLVDEGYTALEITAIQKVEQLRLLGGFELMTLLERGALIQEIEREGLVTVFPGEYERLEDIVQAIGISKTEYSDTRGLCEVVFPWLEAHTDRSLQEWWEDIGKSKFRELLPILRGLIEGESARNHESVNEAIQLQLNNALIGITTEAATAAGRQLNEEEAAQLLSEVTESGELQHRAILAVLEFGILLPVREMRQQVRPSRTPNIQGVVFRGEHYFAVLRMTAEQVLMFNRLVGTHADLVTVDSNDYEENVGLFSRIVPE
jgi:hypothetical protein